MAVPLSLWRRPEVASAIPGLPGPATPAVGAAGAGAVVPSWEIQGQSRAAGASGAAGAGTVGLPAPGTTTPPGPALATVAEVHTVSCHDTGPRRTPREQCDKLPAVEEALNRALLEAASCMPPGAGGGSIVYTADVSFTRKRNPLTLAAPRDGRMLAIGGVKGARTVTNCLTAARQKLVLAFPGGLFPGGALASMPHAHARYKLSVTVSYPPDR